MEINKLYNIDNLELLKQLPSESIDLIYSDILYNTGKKFKDYDDKLGTPQEAMEWYKPRLIEMHRVLKDTGSIYLQCDYRLVHYLKVEMDNIFGLDNFKNDITWKRQPPRGARKQSKQYPRIIDNILYYSKSDSYIYNQQFRPYSDKMMKRYKKDEKGRLYRLGDLGDYSEESILNFEKQGKIYMTKNNKKQLIRFLDEEDGEPISDLWEDISNVNSMAKDRVNYDTQKPKLLLERIIKTSSNEGDIIADFFCGSGTSLVVAKELGRQYIGCDINPKAIEISQNRLDEIN